MTIKASLGVAMILTAGLFVGFAAPPAARAAGEDGATASKSVRATSGKSVRQGSRYLKKRYSYRKSSQLAAKPAAISKPADKEVAGASASPLAMPDAVANANARMLSGDAASDNAKAMSEAMTAKASTILLASADKPDQAQAEPGVVASDQLTDVDRVLQEASSRQTVGMVPFRPAQAGAPTLVASDDNGGWDQTSLIGKICIALGALLTMASAARMFMA